MTPHFPYLGTPCYNRYSRYGYRYPYYSYSKPHEPPKNNAYERNNHEPKKDGRNINSNKNKNDEIKADKCCEDNANNDAPLFNMFGMNLYFDDILLICLIWFLYDEGVKDESLFMTLILLLLS